MPHHPWLQARFSDIRPKAIAALISYFRDIDLAEESFSLACTKALDGWQKQGLPDDPFAWLLTVARNAGRDIIRKNKTRDDHKTQHAQDNTSHDAFDDVQEENEFRDDVLRLLFICCHPKLSIQDQSALALKIVIGLSVEEIACAFLVKSKTMEQRITRAKKTIAKDNIPFQSPDLIERAERLKTVSLMLYLLFNEGWSASTGDVQIKVLLCEEAIYLARLLLSLFPSQTETMGLLALMLFQHARYPARIENDKLILLKHQNRNLWNRTMIAEAHVLLEKALRHGTPGSFQIQAAIAGVHSNASAYEATDWAEIERLYAVLYQFEPTPIVKLNHAVAIAKTKGSAEALKILDDLDKELQNYRWFHSTRAAFLFELGQKDRAKTAYQTALALTPTEPEQAILREKFSNVKNNYPLCRNLPLSRVLGLSALGRKHKPKDETMSQTTMTTPGAAGWIGYSSPNRDEAVKFYRNVMEWTLTDLPMKDGSSVPGILVEDELIGGFSPEPADKGVWTIYITVKDVDDATDKARTAGAKIIREPTDVSGVGRIAIINDPHGARIAMITYESMQK
ncbi:DUF6596 domain-containing protein [Kiloniella sp. EL199]|uniref:DUF6596 domain-containing protein n=1 Tax=Kiloniella sp. EL199 TaxID=2107581 RepID=UPI0013C42CF8|nr:DUF6596 domain-containing protein [Kiloniella sp. EL199]